MAVVKNQNNGLKGANMLRRAVSSTTSASTFSGFLSLQATPFTSKQWWVVIIKAAVKSSSFSLQMSDQDSSTSASQTEGELEGEMDKETNGDVQGEEETDENHRDSSSPSLSSFSSSLRTVMRIKQKYQALKKRRQELALALGGPGTLTGTPARTSPKIFTFDAITPSTLSSSVPQRKKRKRRKRVLFPNRKGRAPPKQEHSRAKYCLYLLFAIVFMQVK